MQQEAAKWLPSRTGKLVQSAAHAAKAQLGEDFVAAVLVGNAMHPERANRGRRPELLIVARRLPPTAIGALASALQSSVAAGVRPRLVTHDELLRGSDVFALEVAEWKVRHWLVDGEDPFAEIEIDRAHLRHALEFQLRGLGRRLRNRVFLGLANQKNEAGRAVLDALDTLAIAAYHTLVCLGEVAPLIDTEAVRTLAESTELDATPVIAVFERARSKGAVTDVADALARLLPFIDGVTRVVDGLEHAEASR